MPSVPRRRWIAAFHAVAAAVALAATLPAPAADEVQPAGQEPPVAVVAATTSHELDLPDRTLAYTATVESLPVARSGDRPPASIAIMSYRLSDQAAADRPVTFVFNGGPGAASVFLHLGALGPRVMVTEVDGAVAPPPARLVDNPATWLTFTDLVFIDPVGTGFSTAAGEREDRPYWSVGADIDALSEVVALWLSRNQRWASPKFLAGESYGGYRAVLLAEALQEDEGVALNGLILLSPVLSFATIQPSDDTVLPWALQLPSMAASARIQGRGGTPPRGDGQAAIEDFALGDYVSGIAGVGGPGPLPPPPLVASTARLLGLPEDLVRRHAGRVPVSVFAKRLLADEGRKLSIYDGAIAGPDPAPARSRGGPDPLLDAAVAAYATAFNTYVRDELGVSTDRPYRVLNRRVSGAWDWDGARGGPGRYGSALDALSAALALNAAMRVMVVHGIYDLVTPYLASVWMIDRLHLPPAVRANVTVEVYEGGHMMYMRPAVRAQLARDAAALYRAAAGG